MWMDGKLMFVGHHRCGISSLLFDRFPEGDSHVIILFSLQESYMAIEKALLTFVLEASIFLQISQPTPGLLHRYEKPWLKRHPSAMRWAPQM